MNEFEQHLRRGTGSHRSFLLPSEVKKAVCDCPVMLTKGVVQKTKHRYQGLYRQYIRAKNEGATHKAWQASGGANSRRSHNQIDGLEIKIDDYFSINGAKLFLPNDPKAPIGETANCDCDVRYIKKKPAFRRETPTSIRLEMEQEAASQARRECDSIYNEIVSLAESASAYGSELVKENASANEYAAKIIPLMEEASAQIGKLAVDTLLVAIPAGRIKGAISLIEVLVRSSGRVAGNPKRIREALDVLLGIKDIVGGVEDILHNINQISNYVDRVNKHTENAKAYDRALKRVEERGEALISRYKQKGCGEHSDIRRVASKITMYKV
jgi:hypothetical protein